VKKKNRIAFSTGEKTIRDAKQGFFGAVIASHREVGREEGGAGDGVKGPRSLWSWIWRARCAGDRSRRP
jgi:hypothetical protein